MQEVLNISDVTFDYGAVTALRGVSVSIKEGEAVGLLGPNGAGKSTLVKLLCGLMPPLSGTLKVFGQDPFSVPNVRRRLGIMHQDVGSEPMLTGWDNLYITGRFFGLTGTQVRQRVDELSEAFGPFDFLANPVLSTSGGQAKRLQVVRMLLHRPQVLLLDEPTVALDTQSRHRFYDAIRVLREEAGITVLWTSHYLDEIERNCERVVMLLDGAVVVDADVMQLRALGVAAETRVTIAPIEAKDIDVRLLSELRLRWASPNELTYSGMPDEFFFETVLPRLREARFSLLSFDRPTPTLEQVYLRMTSEGTR